MSKEAIVLKLVKPRAEENVIKVLKEALEAAKKGRIQGVVLYTHDNSQNFDITLAGPGSFSTHIGRLEQCKYFLMKESQA